MSDETIGELQQIEDLIERLDARVPKDEAKVEMNLYGGGPDVRRCLVGLSWI